MNRQRRRRHFEEIKILYHRKLAVDSQKGDAKQSGLRRSLMYLRGFYSPSELYRLIDRHWSAKFSAIICG
jgi:hypothetical protein